MVTWLRQNGRGQQMKRGQTGKAGRKAGIRGFPPLPGAGEVNVKWMLTIRTATVQAAATKRAITPNDDADRYLTDRGSLTEPQRQMAQMFE